MSDNEKVGAAREYAEHHGIKPWTEHIFNVLDALEVAEQKLAAAQAVIAEVKRYAEDREAYGKRGRTVHSARIASDLLAILSQSSADALQAHDREVTAKALLDAADELTPGDDKVDNWGIEAGLLRARAAALGVPVGTEQGADRG